MTFLRGACRSYQQQSQDASVRTVLKKVSLENALAILSLVTNGYENRGCQFKDRKPLGVLNISLRGGTDRPQPALLLGVRTVAEGVHVALRAPSGGVGGAIPE